MTVRALRHNLSAPLTPALSEQQEARAVRCRAPPAEGGRAASVTLQGQTRMVAQCSLSNFGWQHALAWSSIAHTDTVRALFCAWGVCGVP